MKQTLKLHGRTHGPYGSDPIPTLGWQFNVDNEGGSGYVQFNEGVDLDFKPDPLAQGGTWGAAFEDASGDGILIGSTGEILLLSDGTFAINSGTSPLTLTVNGKTYQFDDSGDLHIPTGGNVIADL
jgi:hypothetical protein